MRTHTRFVVVLLWLAWFLLLFRLDSIPPGFQHDQTFETLSALQVLGGHFPIYFPENFGLNPGFMYAVAGIFRLTGSHYVWGIRFTSALFAMLGLALTLVFARQYLTPRPALVATALTAGSFWFLFAGRLGLEPISLLPPTLACFYFLARTEQRPSFSAYLLAGVMGGIANYIYLAARTLYALPLILLGYEIVLVVLARLRGRARPPQAGARMMGLLVVLLAMLLVSAPLLAYLATHASQGDARIGELAGPFLEAFSHGNLQPLFDNLVDLFRTLLWDGSPWLPFHYAVPGRAVLQPLWAVLFVIGLLITLTRLGHRREFLLLVALLLGLGLTLLTSSDAIHMRSIYALPLLFLLAVRGGVAVVALVQRQLEKSRLGRDARWRPLVAWLGAVALLGLLCWHFADNAIAYFRDWATAEPTQRIYNADFRLATRYLDQNAGQDEIFMGTDRLLDLDSATYALYEPLRGDVDWFRLPGNPPLPARGRAIYVGPTTAEIPPMLHLLLAAGAQEDYLQDAWGRPLMWAVRVTPDVLARAAENTNLRPLDLPVTYESSLRLDAVGWQDRGAEVDLVTQWTSLGPWPHTADPGQPLLQPKAGLTIVDSSGYRWLYEDVPLMLPVHNVRVGLPMMETTTLTLPADMPAGAYHLYLVLYDDKDGPLTMAQGASSLKSTPVLVTTLDIAPRPLAEAPAPPFDVVADGSGAALQAVGRWEEWETLVADVPKDFHISWQAQQPLETTGLTFRIAAYDEHGTLVWQQTATGQNTLPSLWEAGRTLRLSHTVKPEEGAEGRTTVQLRVCADQRGATLGCATADGVQVISQPPIMALERRPQHSVGARWGDSLTLTGYDLSRNGADLGVTLYWQAGDTSTAGPLKRFVHLLDADGGILDQSDEPLENNGIPVTYWRNGEYVVDHPQFASEQVPGVQAVCVGIYDATTEERLAVVTASGEEAPDARLCFR